MIDIREVKGAAAGAVATAVYMALVLTSGRVDPIGFAWLLATYIVIAGAIWALLGGLVVLSRIPRHERVGGQSVLAQLVTTMARERWERDRCISWVWPPLLFACRLASFNAFKQMVLPLAGFGADPMLAAADKALFLGVDPWRVTHAILGSPQLTLLVDRAYHGWFVPMSIGVVACAWLPRATFRLRTQYLLSYICIWIGIGSILAFLLPSAGPAFYEQYLGAHPSFRELMDRLGETQAVTGSTLTALSNQAMLIQLHGSEQLVIGGGISAMPSVHNALAALFALAAFQLNRTAGIALAIYAAVIWVGSIHLGWHYALDGLVAFALTYGIWIACGKAAAALDREDVQAKSAPAHA